MPRPRRLASGLAGLVALAAWFATAPAAIAGTSGFEWDAPGLALAAAPSAPALEGVGTAVSPLALPAYAADGAAAPAGPADPNAGLNSGRARILLRSLALPGWGQATIGDTKAATIFGLIEAGIWVMFAAYQVQAEVRTDDYLRTARLRAGIELSGRDEEFRRIVGSYASSEEYNQLVVYRDAANLYYSDPAAYWAYIEANRLSGSNSWDWESEQAFLDYQASRKDAQRSENRSKTALALAVANRLASALQVTFSMSRRSAQPTTVGLELAPSSVPGDDPTAVRWGLRASF